MKFVDLKNIVRKDSPIHYINEYHGDIVYDENGVTLEHKIEIIIEKTAFGTTNIQVHINDENTPDFNENNALLIDFVNEKYKNGYFKE